MHPLADDELAELRGGQAVSGPALKATKRKVILWDESHRPQPDYLGALSGGRSTNLIRLQHGH